MTVEQAGVLLYYAAQSGIVERQQKSIFRPVSCKSSPPTEPPCMDGTPTTTRSMVATLVGRVDSSSVGTSVISAQTSDVAFFLEDNLPMLNSPFSTTDSRSDAREFKACASRIPAERLMKLTDLDLGECISRGISVSAFKATVQSTRQDVVVKIMNEDSGILDDCAVDDLAAEISIMMSLQHPRIVSFVGACMDPPRTALITEFAPGGNLHHALHVRRHHFSRDERFQLALDLSEGVMYLHSRDPSIAHCDLKSMNLVLDTRSQHLQICDFGLSRVLCDHRCTERGDLQTCRGGSPRYMAPECHDPGLGPITEKVDVWACGCILIEIFGNVLPYAHCSNVQQIVNEMLVNHRSPVIPETVTEAPVRDVIRAMHAIAAEDRLDVALSRRRLQVAASKTERDPP